MRRYLVSSNPETINAGHSPECMAASLGLQEQPCNPWDPAIQSNPTALKQAWGNHALLCNEMAVAIVSQYPATSLTLEHQVEGVEYARKVLGDIDRQANIWDQRIQYADKVSKFIVHQILLPSMNGFEYVDSSGEHVSVIIQQQLLADDLKTALPIVQCAGHLGDLLPENPMRMELEQKFAEDYEQLLERQHKHELTTEEIEAYRKRVKLLMKMCSDERSHYKTKRRQPGVNTQENTSIAKLLDTMIEVAEIENRNFAFIQSTLSE